MALLVISLPAPNPGSTTATQAGTEPPALAWLFSPDGLTITRHGETAPAAWPRADRVVAVVPAQAIAWHRTVAPRAPANRLRAALGGLLEEHLLPDDDGLHLALAPQPTPGEPVWVAALAKPWLQAQLALLAASGVNLDRLVPALAPALSHAVDNVDLSAASGHFYIAPADANGPECPWLAVQDTEGALCLPLAGGMARLLQERLSTAQARFSATPAATASAEHWLGAPVAVRTDAEQALAAARSPWNLLQFDLAPQHRGTVALGKLGRQLLGPAFAQARLGLAVLLVLNILGLNLMAWQQQRQQSEKLASMDALVRSTHPQLRAVLDAPLQMHRETAALRAAAGVPGEDDFEPALAAAAAAWPDGQAPAAQLKFEPGTLSLSAAGWPAVQVEQLRRRLQATGWALENAEGRLTLRRVGSK